MAHGVLKGLGSVRASRVEWHPRTTECNTEVIQMLMFRDACGTRVAVSLMAFVTVLGANRCASAADETLPTPAEVGAANDAAWESIAFIDMEYVVSTRLVEQGRVVVERESGSNRWVRTPTHERLLLRDLDGKGLAVDRLVGEKVIRLLQYPVDMDFTADPIRPCDDRPVKATISPASPGVLDELVPQNMELLHFTRSAPRMRLSELLRTWKVGEISRTTGPDDDKRLAMTAELRPGGGEGAYSVVKLTVNSSKGYLVERAEMVEADAARAIDSGEGGQSKRYGRFWSGPRLSRVCGIRCGYRSPIWGVQMPLHRLTAISSSGARRSSL